MAETPSVILSPVLARALAASRPQLNARVAVAKRARAGFDDTALAEAIRSRLDPVARAVEVVAPDKVTSVVEAGFDIVLGLVAQGVSGDRGALIDLVWRTLGVAYARSVAERPLAVLAMLTNAALTIAATQGARVDDWIERMARIAPMVTADTVAAVGQIVAWRSGMAHYRAGAIGAADRLPDELAAAAVGATGRWADIRSVLIDDPWWTPERDAAPGATFGGFMGFGGPFAEPPVVRAGTQGFLVRSGPATGLLIADACGATLHPADPNEFDSAAAGMLVRIDGRTVVGRDRSVATDLPADGLAAVASAGSVAIFSRYSHYVRIEPWR